MVSSDAKKLRLLVPIVFVLISILSGPSVSDDWAAKSAVVETEDDFVVPNLESATSAFSSALRNIVRWTWEVVDEKGDGGAAATS